jgi:NAD(P)-dependent dehydrogenase (short-subunit alcohol dehydrogenase family)
MLDTQRKLAVVTGASTGIGLELARECAKGGVLSGWQNKLQAAAAHVIPAERLAKKHSETAAPGTAEK